MSKVYTTVGLGEVLWDLLPDGKQLGGAPANFAYISGILGDLGVVASRVGDDLLGEEVLQRLSGLALETAHLQSDPVHPTGTVNVQLDATGQPQFEIIENVAWDFLEWTPEWRMLAEDCDAVCFGSLSQRSPQSRETVRAFLRATRPEALRVFDVNLRQAFYSAEVIAESFRLSGIVKLNREELPRVMDLLKLPTTDEKASAQLLRKEFGLKLVCLTRGGEGSLIVSEDEIHEHPGFPVKVVDTVGAGDAFTAALVYEFLRGSPLNMVHEKANRMGAWVAGRAGATPTPGADFGEFLSE